MSNLVTCLLLLEALYGIPSAGSLKYSNLEDVTLVTAVITVESAWKPKAKSSAGALGLMQVMPATGKEVLTTGKGKCILPTDKLDLLNPDHSVMIGTCYLKLASDRWNGNVTKMLLQYHGGYRAVTRFEKGGMDAVNKTTRAYVSKVLALYLSCQGGDEC